METRHQLEGPEQYNRRTRLINKTTVGSPLRFSWVLTKLMKSVTSVLRPEAKTSIGYSVNTVCWSGLPSQPEEECTHPRSNFWVLVWTPL